MHSIWLVGEDNDIWEAPLLSSRQGRFYKKLGGWLWERQSLPNKAMAMDVEPALDLCLRNEA